MFEFREYDATFETPNVVVDGAANSATVLTLSHWPGAPTPEVLQRDLSAAIAFAYLEHPVEAASALVVTNNHYDQDGLVSVLALVEPDRAQAHRDLLIDLAAAGDFGIYRDRRAARASMVIARWSDGGLGYTDTLDRVIDLVNDPEPWRADWEAEDAHLAESEAAILDGRVTIDEDVSLDLAIVRVLDPALDAQSHRFAHETIGGVHPMALHNATQRFRLLVDQGGRVMFIDRYETWVQYQSRAVLPRVDLRPLARELSRDDVEWRAGDPNELTPQCSPVGRSRRTFEEIVDAFRDALRASPEHAARRR